MSSHADPPPPIVKEPHSIQYVVKDQLGKGGFAICYRAEQCQGEKPTGKLVALKIVKSRMEPQKLAQKFVTELQLHSKIRHPHIVGFDRAFTFGLSTYVVLEICDNGSLADALKKRKFFTMPEIRRFLVQTCGAVKYLHNRNIVHRDLKTGNIFLDKNMNVKVGDFGLAACLVGEGALGLRRTTMCGTPNYLAPEILERSGKGHNEKVDLWAIGIIAYTLAVGKPPFHATTREEIYKKLQKRDYKWPDHSSNTSSSTSKSASSHNIFSPHLQDLVSSLLVDEDNRPSPDEIVCHQFFRMSYVPDRLDSSCTYAEPTFPNLSTSSRDQALFRSMIVDGFHRNWHMLCAEAGVGERSPGILFDGVGLAVGKSVFRDLEREIKANRAPTVPIASDRVYLPFDMTAEGKMADTNDRKKGNGKNRAKNDAIAPASLSDISEEKDSSSSTVPSTLMSVKSRLVEITANDRMLAPGSGKTRTLGISSAAAARRNLATSTSVSAAPTPRIRTVQHTDSSTKENVAPGTAEPERLARNGISTFRSVKECAERYEQLAGTTRQDVQTDNGATTGEQVDSRNITATSAKTPRTVQHKRTREELPIQEAQDVDKQPVTGLRRTRSVRVEGTAAVETKNNRPQRLVGGEVQIITRTRSVKEFRTQTAETKTDVLALGELRSQRVARAERPRRVPTPSSQANDNASTDNQPQNAVSTKAIPEKRKRVITPQTQEQQATVPKPIRPTTRSASGSLAVAQRERSGIEKNDSAGVTKVEMVIEAGTIRRRNNPPTSVTEQSDDSAKSRSASAASTVSTSSTKGREQKSIPTSPCITLPNTDPAVALHYARELQVRLLYALQGKEAPSSKLKGSPMERALSLHTDSEIDLPFVSGWVDWTTKHGIAYVLSDGTVGTISASSATSAGGVTYVVVQDGISKVQKMVSSVSGLKNAKEALSSARCDCDYQFWTETSSTGVIHDASKVLGRDQREGGVAMWNKCVKYMYKSNQETWAATQETKKGADEDMIILRYYQRLGTVGVFGFSNGCFQFNFPDHTKLVLSPTGMYARFTVLPSAAVKALRETGNLPMKFIRHRSVLSGTTFSLLNGDLATSTNNSKVVELARANLLVEKLSFIADLAGVWVKGRGLGGGSKPGSAESRTVGEWPVWNGLSSGDCSRVDWVKLGGWGRE